jgi:nucleoside-diphosphate-sugar epimerase
VHLHNVETIIHFAGVAHNNHANENEYDGFNHQTTLKLALDAAGAGVKRFIFISSTSVYGITDSKDVINESSEMTTNTLYGRSKVNAESGLFDISQKTNLEIVIIRSPLVYGPKAPGNVGKLMQLISKFPILPFGLLNNKRSYISLDNLSYFVLLCIESPAAKNEVFLVRDEEDYSTKEFSFKIANALGKRVIQIPLPLGFLLGVLGQSKANGLICGDFRIDDTKARKLLGWIPKFNDFS